MELCAGYSDDIPNLPDREDRYTEIMVDCYNDSEVFGAFDAYLSDAIDYPFEATWRIEDSQDRKDWVTVTVLALSSKGTVIRGQSQGPKTARAGARGLSRREKRPQCNSTE